MTVSNVKKERATMRFIGKLVTCLICLLSTSSLFAHETWHCEPQLGTKQIGLRYPEALLSSELEPMNFTISEGKLTSTVVTAEPYSFVLNEAHSSPKYRTYIDVSRWATNLIQINGTFEAGLIANARRTIVSHDQHYLLDYICKRK
jgi:hypothetical protein